MIPTNQAATTFERAAESTMAGARVLADHSALGTNFAVSLGPHDFVVRCVPRASHSDHTAVATMLCEGRFVWGAIVYEEAAGSALTGWVECFHVSELDRLVERLVELREVLGAGAPAFEGGV